MLPPTAAGNVWVERASATTTGTEGGGSPRQDARYTRHPGLRPTLLGIELSPSKLMVLVLIGLIVLGPNKLPSLAQ
jgi:hypothetical protein